MLGDFRYALRSLTRRPSFAVAAIALLGIGITVNTIVFTVIDALVLRPMPVPDAARVVRLYPVDATGRRQNLFSYPDYRDYRDHAPAAIESMAAYMPADATSGRWSDDAGVAAPRAMLAYVVSPEYSTVTRMQPALGRLLVPADDREGAPAVAVIGHAFWRSRFNANPAVVGSTLVINGRPFTIVGVASPDFAGTEPLVADAWVPVAANRVLLPAENGLQDRERGSMLVIARLTRGGSASAAQAALSVVAQRLLRDYPGRSRPVDVEVARGTFFTIDPGARPVIAIVLGTAALVLLIAAANVANLTLARAASQQREVAIRLAIGAGRWRIVRQLVAEALLLAVGAGAVALLLSGWTLRLLYTVGVSLAPFPWAISLDLSPDPRIFAYTFALAAVTGVMFGLVPALQIASTRVATALHEDGTMLGTRISRSRARRVLAAAQIAGCLVLLVDAGLLVRGLRTAQALDLGFRADRVLYSEYDLRQANYSSSRAATFTQSLIDSTARVPGVVSAALTSHVPLTGGVRRARVTLADRGHEPLWTITSTVSSGYFDTLGIAVVTGRAFTAEDASAPVAIVSEGLARRFWPGEPAIGRALTLDTAPQPLTVVGVVRDASNGAIWREKEIAVYRPIQASTDPRDLRLIVRTSGDPAVAAKAIHALAARLDPDLRFSAAPLEQVLRLWLLPSRAAAIAAVALGLLAALVAAIGVYAVIAFAVSHRTRELGIRMALGANALDVVRLVVGEGSRLIIVGLGIGGVLALATAPLLGRMLFGISAFDPVTYAAVTAFLAGVAVLASYVPARRAAALLPVDALRSGSV